VTDENHEEKKILKEKPEKIQPIKEWIKKQSLTTTADIKVPELLLDQVIGQDKAVDIVRKAAEQKRHVMLIGDPGTGKSMVARAMTAFLPKEELEDIIVYPNNDDSNTPHIRVVPGGKANEIVKAQREEAKKKKEQQNSMIFSIAFLILIISAVAAFYEFFTDVTNPVLHIEYLLFGGIFAFIIILFFSRGALMQRNTLHNILILVLF